MAKEHPRLKLGKRAAFVKTHLKRLPQEEETWEVDFRALPKPAGQTDTHYLGLAVALPRGDPLVYLPVEYTPTVNDLADLLADAMRRPLTGSARRPEHLHFRANPRWDELFPHLKELGIEATLHDDLPELGEVYLDFLREMRKASPGPVILLSPRPADPGRRFPALAITSPPTTPPGNLYSSSSIPSRSKYSASPSSRAASASPSVLLLLFSKATPPSSSARATNPASFRRPTSTQPPS